jgi:4-amino-4-deoxy-L-arabinose transferase-like glycosyltransferase
MVFILLFLSTITAVFIGLAFGLALFGTLLATRVFRIKTLVSYAATGALAFLLVMVPWSHIKTQDSPATSGDSLEIGSNTFLAISSDFNPEKELYELVLTQAALLNLGGEFPPESGLGIANENRIFGAPVYNADNRCGRFLTGIEPDGLWGKIETSYRDRCVQGIPLQVISFVNRASHLLYPIVGTALLFGFLLSLRFAKHLRQLMVPGLLALTPYLLLDASISRYGAFLIPLGCVLLTNFVTSSDKLESPKPMS